MTYLELKVPPLVVLLIAAILMAALAPYWPGLNVTFSQWLLMSLSAALGLAFSLAGSLTFVKADTTVNPLDPEQTSALVTSGIYQYSRNPMYVGFALFLAAFAWYLFNLNALIIWIGFVVYLQRFQIIPEERFLTAKFTEQYTLYKNKVRPWL